MNKFYKTTIFTITTSILFSACSTTTQKGTVGVEREQLMFVSSADMVKNSHKAYASVLSQAKKENKLNVDKHNTKRIKDISKKLIKQTPIFRKNSLSWDWEANLITSKELNAWCMPGGKIAFYTGIIEKLKLTDDEIAAIMGHEISHALREHSRERTSHNMLAGSIINIGGSLLGLGSGAKSLASKATNVAILLPNSRAQESEADYMGVELAARAGYNPQAAIEVWKKMKKASKGAPPEFLSTHPSHDTRIEELKAYVDVVTPLYLQHK